MLPQLSRKSENADLFVSALANLASYLETEGIVASPYSDNSLSRFVALPIERQSELLCEIIGYYDECAQLIRDGYKLKNSVKVAKKILADRGLHVSAGFFDLVEEDDILEVFRPDFTQIFRNVSFLKYNSYDLAMPWVTQWTDLYRRPESITEKLVDKVISVLSHPENGIAHADLPIHVLEEIFSPKRNVFKIEQKYLAPVFDRNDNCAGFVATLALEYMGSKKANTSNLEILH